MWFRILAGVVFFAVAIWIGYTILRGLGRPIPEDEEIVTTNVEIQNVRYRCSVCGMEIRLTRSPGEDLKPPKHCREEMELVG